MGFFCVMGATFFCTSGATNNILVGMQTLAPADMRATLVALAVLASTLFGLCIGPPLSAVIATHAGGVARLDIGVATLAAVVIIPCIVLLAWSRRGVAAPRLSPVSCAGA
jgi:hypothetical protein